MDTYTLQDNNVYCITIVLDSAIYCRCLCYCVPVFYVSSECSCGWVCIGCDALGPGTCLVQGGQPKQDAVQHQQLPQWEYTGEEILQGAYTLRHCKLLHFYQYVLCVVSDHFFYPKDPLIKGQRCVILADGFYEWKKQEKGKQPFFIYFPQTQGKKEDQNDPTTSALNNNSETASPDLTEVSSGFSIVI